MQYGDWIELHHNSISGPVSAGPQYNFFAPSSELLFRNPDEWLAVRRAEPIAFGVHRARGVDGEQRVSSYVERDQDSSLRERVRKAAEGGGLVLVTGDSMAGKSRTLFEAMATTIPDFRVLAPPRGASLRGLPRILRGGSGRYVLWLDDVEGYLGADGLSPEILAELSEIGVPVLATICDTMLDICRPAARHSAAQIRDAGANQLRPGCQVLSLAEIIELERQWSPFELERVAASGDPLLLEALARHGSHGIAEYIAAGPDLLALWRRARRASHTGGHPRGYALVAAAVDLARAGFCGPLPVKLLRVAHKSYLRKLAHLRLESFDEALAWATHIHYGAASLLVIEDQHPDWGWRAFPYLTDAAARDPSYPSVPGSVWSDALTHARTDRDRNAIASAAYSAGLRNLAHRTWSSLASNGDMAAALSLVGLYLDERNEEEADRWADLAIELAHQEITFELGGIMARSDVGRLMLMERAELGDSLAAFSLAREFVSSGDLDEGEVWYRRAAAAGDIAAKNNLGMMLHWRGEAQESKKWLMEAAGQGDEVAARNLALIIEEESNLP
ncbi:hypothetical protein [Streptomyces sp. LS1784]|uniref:hypothetical protein n=1 Tax=Streptomyces sp. LS1784 TaxID=2851533 RepID=UPI001CCECF66|nr:hypothetical protein [Streptomyces sp. LS1784]